VGGETIKTDNVFSALRSPKRGSEAGKHVVGFLLFFSLNWRESWIVVAKII